MNEKWRHLWTIPRKDKTLWHLVKKSNSWHQNDGIDELLLIFTMNRTSKVHVLKPIVLKKVSNETKNMVKEMGHRCVYLFLLRQQKRFSANWTRFEIQIISQIKSISGMMINVPNMWWQSSNLFSNLLSDDNAWNLKINYEPINVNFFFVRK